MSKTVSNNSANSTTTKTDQQELPCVQYGFSNGEGPRRAPKLRTIFEPIPDDATTASPIYKIAKEQYERQDDFETGYEVKGGSSIATEMQDECEEDDRVLCPVHIESDAYHDVGAETLISWFQEFVEDYLEVPFNTCTLYFSGNRSIHVHVPRFVSGKADREGLKGLAKSFREEAGADLDLGLYSRKRLFRLPGVDHEKSGLSKVEIEPTWDRTRIFRESNEKNPNVSASYADVLWNVFVQEPLTRRAAAPSTDRPKNLFQVLDPDKTLLEFASEGQENEIETPLIEQISYPEDAPDVVRWLQYNAKEFSPYALASGNGRSVAAVKVKGTPFARKNVRGGAALIPAYFYGARGCAGEKFTKGDEHAPVQLSDRDFDKWDSKIGDNIVIIGGRSRNSRILTVDRWDATVVGHALTGEDGSRSDALDYLSSEGYDVGSSGSGSSTVGVKDTSSEGICVEERTIWPARSNPQTDAEELQQKAEQGDIGNLTHPERIQVACRHLQYGWKPTWEWFKEQFGSNFKPNVTWKFLRGIVEDPDFEEYDHINVPDQPT